METQRQPTGTHFTGLLQIEEMKGVGQFYAHLLGAKACTFSLLRLVDKGTFMFCILVPSRFYLQTTE